MQNSTHYSVTVTDRNPLDINEFTVKPRMQSGEIVGIQILAAMS